MKGFRFLKFVFIGLLFFPSVNHVLLAQTGKTVYTPSELRLKWYNQFLTLENQSLFKGLKWQFLGPINISGRMTDVEVIAPKGKNYTIYVAGASGGVWKTENEGTTWEPIFESEISASIGDIALAPSDQRILWVGTGEANIFRSSQSGAGVFKSVDGGKKWIHMGLTGTQTISRIVIHPENPDVVYVAASGHEWTHNPDRGVYKTTNGGKTWEKIFFVNEKTGAIDLVMDPSNSEILFAATWQRIRKKWNDPRNEIGYDGSGIHKTVDGGKTWTMINNGLPEPQFRGRIGIDICKTKPQVLYAYIDSYQKVGEWKEDETDSYGRPKGGMIHGATVFRTDNQGETWYQVSQENEYMRRLSATYGWVFGQIRVDPNDENKIYVMGLNLNLSEDGGKTFRPLRGMHVDHHGLWIDPENSLYLVNVNDGGVVISYDGGKNWRVFTDNLPLVQFFNCQVDMAEPFHVYGSIQDHGSYRGVVDLSRGRNNIPAVAWESAPGGEGSNHAVDPSNPNIVYSAEFYGAISRTDLSKNETKEIVPVAPQGEPPYRGQWLAPFIVSPHDTNTIYHGMNYLFRSRDRGNTWERISPDLTYNDKNKQGDIQYQTLFTISESPLQMDLIYVGTDDGRVHVTKDGGKNWREITRGAAPQKWISRIVASAYDVGTVYMSQNGKRDDDFKPYLWKSTNFGDSWKSIVANIPIGPINVIREDSKNKDVLYVGTDLAVYVTINGGKEWQVLASGMPHTYIHDLVVQPREGFLLAATHGRGMYIMDIRYIQQIDANILAKPIHVFDMDRARLPRQGWWGTFGGQNAYVYYFLNQSQTVKCSVKDQSGSVIREFELAGDKGMNQFVWDLTVDKNSYIKEGDYTLSLSAGNASEQKMLAVDKPQARGED